MDFRPVPAINFDLCRRFECGPSGGFASVHYLDPSGCPTIAWGHRIVDPEDQKYLARSIDAAAADALLTADLEKIATYLWRHDEAVIATLLDRQYAAILDFSYNLGPERFLGSTLHMYIKAGDIDRVAGEFGRWVFAGGRLLMGLVKRRAAEAAVWNGADIAGAFRAADKA